MKKIIIKAMVLSLAALLALAFVPFFFGTAKADTGEPQLSDDGFVYEFDSDLNGYVIVEYVGDPAMNIPAYFDGIRVKSINSIVFNQGYYLGLSSTKVTKITFPTLTADELNAGGPITVSSGALAMQALLTSVDLSDSAQLSGDGQQFFYGDTALASFACSADSADYAVKDGVLFSHDKSELIQYPPAKADSSYAIPSGVTALGDYCFWDSLNLTSISFPDTLDGITGTTLLGCKTLAEIDTTNPAYSTQDGILFNADKSKLVCFPPAKAGSYTIPDSVTAIAIKAFDSATALTDITIPAGLTDLGADPASVNFVNPFNGCTSLAQITVADGKSALKVDGGVLFNNDETTLIAYPPARTATDHSSVYSKIKPAAVPAVKAESRKTAADVLNGMPKGLPESVYKAAVKAAVSASEKPAPSKKTSTAVKNSIKMDGQYTVPDSVETIACGAFDQTTLTVVAFSQSSAINNICKYAFMSGTVSLSAVSDSSNDDHANAVYNYVKTYASQNSIPFIEGKPIQGDFRFSINGSTATVTGYVGNDTDITIPSKYTNKSTEYTVTAIGDSAFSTADDPWETNGITHIAIPSTVTSIEKYAFEDCMELTGVLKIPNSVTEIGEGCFMDCSNLTGVILPDNPDFQILNDKTFEGCMSLTDIEIPSTVTSLGDDCFDSCAFTHITIPAGVTSIGADCFDSCRYLTGIALPDGLLALQDETFFSCESLQSATFGAGSQLSKIGESCFSGCALTGFAVPAGVTEIDQDCFDSCEHLQSITLPDNLGTLNKDTFIYCVSLKNITIPESVSTIDSECFEFCSSLENISIPKSVIQIYDNVFSYCDSLQYFAVDPDNGDYQSSIDGVLFNKTNTGKATELICYPTDKPDTAYDIPPDVTKVDDNAFTGTAKSALTSVTMHANVASADNAFEADSLQYIYVDAGNTKYANNFVNSVSDGVLYDHDKTTIILYPFGKPDKVYNIPDTMTSVVAPSLCWRLFETVNIPASVTDFEYDSEGGGDEGEVKASYGDGSNAAGIFSFCPNLLNINVDPLNPLYMSSDGVVYNKVKKNSIILFPTGRTGDYTIPGGVTTINDYAFFGCSLSRVFFKTSNMKLGAGAFEDSMLEAAVFYGNPFDWDESSDSPFDYDIEIYYHVSKAAAWKNFGDSDEDSYDTQPFCTLTLNFQDGVPNQQLMAPITDGHVSAPDNPSRTGCSFAGWYKDAACVHAWSTSGIVKNDFTLYARWMSDAPATVTASSQYYNTISISWSSVTNAAGYEISRATSQNGKYKVIATTKASVLTYTNKSVTTGTPYYYRVRAFTQAGKNKFYSNYAVAAAVTANLAAPAAPTVAPASYKSMKISWAKVPGATKYVVYRATASDPTNFVAVKTTSSRSYTDNGAMLGTYYYKIKAMRGKASSTLSDASSAKTTTLGAPAIKVAHPSAGVYTVSWKAVDGATGYEIFVDGSQYGGDFKKTSCTVTGLASGVSHSIYVVAYRWVGNTKVTGIVPTPITVTP
jgi:uncharacterized repeat protein (TIGR02543 family)